jgi:hypothetical protein
MQSQELTDFMEYVNSCKDLEHISYGRDLLLKMSRIINLRNEAEKLEEDLVTEDSIKFYMLIAGASEEEVQSAAEVIKGRAGLLTDKYNKEEAVRVLGELEKEGVEES